jgi:hypothetical protein
MTSSSSQTKGTCCSTTQSEREISPDEVRMSPSLRRAYGSTGAGRRVLNEQGISATVVNSGLKPGRRFGGKLAQTHKLIITAGITPIGGLGSAVASHRAASLRVGFRMIAVNDVFLKGQASVPAKAPADFKHIADTTESLWRACKALSSWWTRPGLNPAGLLVLRAARLRLDASD